MTLIYYNIGENLGLPDLSPFCLKLESFLRLHDVDFTVSDLDIRKKLSKAPKKKVPFVEFENGELMGDSDLIIRALAKSQDIDLFPGLDKQQRGIAHSVMRMLDEHYYFCLVYGRWIDDAGWSVMEPLLFSEVPSPIRGLISGFMRKKIRKNLWAQGIGRHSADEVYAIAKTDLQAVSDILGADTWFFGTDAPSLIDICVHSYLANVLYVEIDSGLRDGARQFENLAVHTNRVHTQIYGKALATEV